MTRVIFRTIAAALMMSALVTACSAQSILPGPVQPDAYVRGMGVITIGSPAASLLPANTGILQTSIVRSGLRLYGGFAFSEVQPDGKRVASISSRMLKTLKIEGNTATVTADGMYNGRPACLTLEVVDDPGSGDWYSIRADGCLLAVVYYGAAGGVQKGDLVVWQKKPPYLFAKGAGAIKLPLASQNAFNIGSFRFQAESSPYGPRGAIAYSVHDPRVASPINRPLIRIYVPSLKGFNVQMNKATMMGFGTLNDRLVSVHVVAIDNAPLPGTDMPQKPDWFSIKAFDPVAATVTPVYAAEGYLLNGEIVVGSRESIAL